VDQSNRASAVAATVDGGKVAFGQQQGQAQVVEVTSKRTLAQIAGTNSRTTALAFSEDGTLLVVGSAGGMVQIHRVTPKAEKLGEGAHHRSTVTAWLPRQRGKPSRRPTTLARSSSGERTGRSKRP